MNLTKKQTREFMTFAESVARGSGRILKAGFSRSKKVNYKGRIDPVTQFDLRSEKYINDRIAGAYPEHSVLAEEGSGQSQDSPFRWIIDPLDGTVNYAHGFPVYSVSIALEYKDTPVAGAVFDPERGELFLGGADIGAFLNGKRIKVSTETKLQRAMLATGFGYNIATARINNLGYFARMAKKAQAIRRAGSAALDLCWLACGRLDGFWEYHLHPWDTAAAALIVRQAGGRVTRINSERYSIFDNNILASNGRLHRQMKQALTGR